MVRGARTRALPGDGKVTPDVDAIVARPLTREPLRQAVPARRSGPSAAVDEPHTDRPPHRRPPARPSRTDTRGFESLVGTERDPRRCRVEAPDDARRVPEGERSAGRRPGRRASTGP